MNTRSLYQDKIAVPFSLLVLSLLSFALLSPWLGFLQDDWYIMWHAHAFGPSIFFKFFSWERPGLAGIYWITSSLLGTSPLVWQFFVVICRWLVTVIFWWMLRLVWPRWTQQVTWIAFLFAVYPGFRSLHFAVMFSNLLLILTIHIFSFCAMILAVRHPRWYIPLTFLAVLSEIFSLFSVEYFFGWELLRPLFLWIALRENGKSICRAQIKSILLHWTPYIAAATSFFIWRIFIIKFPTKYQPVLLSETIANPPTSLLKMVRTIIQDMLDTNLFAWERTLSILKGIESQETSTLLALGLAVVIGVAVGVWLLKWGVYREEINPGINPDTINTWAKNAIYVGLFSTLLSGWPFWFVDIDINTEIGPDRFTLAFMMGVCILMVGLLELLIRTQTQKILLISVLIGLASAQHFQDANTLRRVHEAQGYFFRQLTWRIPGLIPGTLLLTDKFPIIYTSDTSLTAPLNWIYVQKPPYSMQYAFFELESRLGNIIPELKPNIPISYGYRATRLSSSTSNVVVFNYSPPGCLQVIDPNLDLSSTLPELVVDAIHLSNLDQIVLADSPVQIPIELFGSEPEPDWCFYYEKADLARQTGNWDIVVDLGEKAFKKGYYPEKPVELLPFIESYIHTDQLLRARQLTIEAQRKEPALQSILCATWERSIHTIQLKDEQRVIVEKVTDQLGCGNLTGMGTKNESNK